MATRIYDPTVKVPGFLRFSKVIAWLMYVWVIFGIITLAFRVFLLAFSASTTSGFYQFVMRTSTQYLNPFRGLFPTHPVGETGYLDVSALFAIIVYLFVAWGFSALVAYIQAKIDLAKDTQQAAINEKKRAELATQAQPRPARSTTRRTV